MWPLYHCGVAESPKVRRLAKIVSKISSERPRVSQTILFEVIQAEKAWQGVFFHTESSVLNTPRGRRVLRALRDLPSTVVPRELESCNPAARGGPVATLIRAMLRRVFALTECRRPNLATNG